jgi:hypothetical protein
MLERPMGETSEINEKIARCIDIALQKLGGSIEKAIYYYLKKDFDLERLDIAEKTEVFEKALVSIFGEHGAKVIEELILAEIRRVFELKPEYNSTLKEIITKVKSIEKYSSEEN